MCLRLTSENAIYLPLGGKLRRKRGYQALFSEMQRRRSFYIGLPTMVQRIMALLSSQKIFVVISTQEPNSLTPGNVLIEFELNHAFQLLS